MLPFTMIIMITVVAPLLFGSASCPPVDGVLPSSEPGAAVEATPMECRFTVLHSDDAETALGAVVAIPAIHALVAALPADFFIDKLGSQHRALAAQLAPTSND